MGAFIVLSGLAWLVGLSLFAGPDWSWGMIFAIPAMAFLFIWGAGVSVAAMIVLALAIEFVVLFIKALASVVLD